MELKNWEITDAAIIAPHVSSKKVQDNLRDGLPYPYTVSDAENYIKTCMIADKKTTLARAIVVGGRAVGSIGIFVKDNIYCKSAEIGYWLAEEYWGKGIMTESIIKMCELAFSQFDIVRIFAEPFAYNAGSRRALEKAGFILEGIMRMGAYKNGEVIDYCMYALLKQ